MIATVVIESGLAIYAAYRYKVSPLTRLITMILLALATFQLAEYFVCTGFGLQGTMWSRIGFAAITTLPALGFHALHILAGKPRRRLVQASYGMMAAFMAVFLLYPIAFSAQQCNGNYVIFQLRPLLGGAYYVYYFGWLLAAIVLGAHWANELRAKGVAVRQKLQTVQAMILGYLVFLVPVTLVNSISPATRRGIPSIMCGFAVVFALILGLYVLPRAAARKPGQNLSAKPAADSPL